MSRESPRRRYRDFIYGRWIPALGSLRLDKVKAEHVRRVLDDMAVEGLASRTIRQARAVLSKAFNDAVAGELLSRNPTHSAKAPKLNDPNLVVLEPDHVIAVLEAAEDSGWRIPLLLSGMTGARRSEVLGVKWSDINLDARRLTIQRSLQLNPETNELEFLGSKTERSRRTVTVTPTAVDALRAHRIAQNERRLACGVGWQDLDLVCDRGDGAPLHPDHFTKATKRIMKRVGLPKRARLHDLRHGVAVLLALEGVPLEAVSAILGHSSAGFTLTFYRHVVDEMTSQAADALERRLGTRAASGTT